jgi:flavin-dependent thymidylate synthase
MAYKKAVDDISKAYDQLINQGVKPEDARGILPTNILTNILMKINLRALSEMLGKRLCERTQGEFREVAEKMRALVIDIHPWAEKILQPSCIFPGYCPFKNYKDCWRKKNGNN